MKTIRFRVKFARSVPDPVYDAPDAKRHFLFCRVVDVPRDLPKDPNPRAPKINRSIWRDIRKHLLNAEGTPNTFHLKNKGITLIASQVTKVDETEYDVVFKPGDGILDGGHTYELIVSLIDEIRELNASDNEQIDQYVKFEVLTGSRLQPIAAEIAGGLNTAIQVQQMSLENLKNEFAWMKEALQGEPYFNDIAFRENDPGEYDVRDMVAILDLFNIGSFANDGSEYPLRAYMKKAEVLDHYVQHRKEYEALRPILKQILVLHDIISATASDLHNRTGGKAGHLSFIEKKETKEGREPKPYRFIFSGQEATRKLPDAVLYPMLGAFRWMVEKDPATGLAKWRGSFEDVKALWHRVGGELMRATQLTSQEYGRNIYAVGRSRNHWATQHGLVVKSQLMLAAQKN